MTATTTASTATQTPPEAPNAPVVPKPANDRRIAALRRFALSITLFNVAGQLVLGFEQAPVVPIVAVLAAYTVDLVLESLHSWATRRPPRYRGGVRAFVDHLLPAHIMGLACAMLLYGNSSLWPVMFAVTAAVGSKYLLKVRVGGRWRHTLNPSNAGIALTLLLFPWVGIAPPYHFTNNVGTTVDWLLPLGILAAGSLLNGKLTGKLPLILAWIAGFVAQAVLRHVLLDHALLAALLPMTGVAFVVFTNYMITDPGTTPVRLRNQVVFGLTTAALYGALVSLHVVFGLFFALALACLLRTLALASLPLLARNRRPVTVPTETPALPAGAPAGS